LRNNPRRYIIFQFISDCSTKDSKKLKKTVNTFFENGHSIRAFINQKGNYIMSEGCKLEEKKKYKLIYVIWETEKKLI